MNTKHAQQKTLYIPVIRLPFWFSVSFFFVSGKKSFVLLRFKKFLLHYFIFFFYVFFLCFQNVIRNSAGFLHVALSWSNGAELPPDSHAPCVGFAPVIATRVAEQNCHAYLHAHLYTPKIATVFVHTKTPPEFLFCLEKYKKKKKKTTKNKNKFVRHSIN